MRAADPVEILRRLARARVELIVVGMAAGILRGWVIDPEGNKVELWEPPAGQ